MPKVTRKVIYAEQLLAEVLKLRIAGLSVREIGEKLDMSVQKTANVARSAFRRICPTEMVEQHRKLAIARIEDLYRNAYIRYLSAVVAQDDEKILKFTDALLKVNRQYCEVLGLQDAGTTLIQTNVQQNIHAGQAVSQRVLSDPAFASRYLELVGPVLGSLHGRQGDAGGDGVPDGELVGPIVDVDASPQSHNGTALEHRNGTHPPLNGHHATGPREDDAGGESIPGVDPGELAPEEDPPLE